MKDYVWAGSILTLRAIFAFRTDLNRWFLGIEWGKDAMWFAWFLALYIGPFAMCWRFYKSEIEDNSKPWPKPRRR